MAGFARWLREAKNLSQPDKAAAICATPPHLEGALLSRLSKNKLCEDIEHIEPRKDNNDYHIVQANVVDATRDKIAESDDVDEYSDKSDGLDDNLYEEELEVPSEEDLPISNSKVQLIDAWSTEEDIHLTWAIDPPSSHRFRCTGVTASRTGGLPKHIACHRAVPENVVLRGFKIDPMENYSFCIALEEMSSTDTPLSLVLGCGASLKVRQISTYRATFPSIVPIPVTPLPEVNILRVSEVRSNVTSNGQLTVLISVMGLTSPKILNQRLSSTDSRYQTYNCYVVLAVLSGGSLVAQKDSPCQSNLEISMEGFVRGPYEVCASLTKFKAHGMSPICVIPQLIETEESLGIKAGFKNLNTALVGVALGLMVIIIGLVWFVRKILKKPTRFEPHRCFRAEAVTEETPRANYVMLTATSKV